MAATAQHLIGQLADGRFPLRKLLGVSQNSAVFLTSGDGGTDAAIKLIPEDPANSERQLERWRAVAALEEPEGILRILHFGRCQVDGAPCLYVVTELADEDLGQLLPRRALSTEETSGVLASVLPALDYLHEKGLVHGGVKPTNIHAIGDTVKLSVDRVQPAGESASCWPLAAAFAAPESVLFPASDIWALAATICEALTKKLPDRRPSGRYLIPELPAPFAQVVKSAIMDDATVRITLDEVRALLDPSFVAKPKPSATTTTVASPTATVSTAKGSSVDTPEIDSPYVRPPEAPDSPESLLSVATESPVERRQAPRLESLPQVDPLSVPLSPVSPTAASSRTAAAAQPARAPIPVTSLPQVNATIGNPRRAITPNPTPRSNRLFLASAAAAVILAVLLVPRLLVRTGASNSADGKRGAASNSANTPAPKAKNAPAAVNSAPVDLAPAGTGKASSPSEGSAGSRNSTPTRRTATPTTAPVVAPIPARPTPAPAESVAKSDAPTIVRKVLPEVSEKARSTIRGTVRINVRVQLNPDGTVSSAELVNPVGSEFFGDLALKAARQWQFEPSSSEPVIKFDFTPTSTAASLL